MSWPWLPLDIYVHIFNQLPVSVDGDESSTKILSNCCQTNSQVRGAAILPSIWEPHYSARYTHADTQRELARKEKHNSDWRMMFYDRRRLDRLAVKLLDEVIEEKSGRTSRTRELCSLSHDVWNALDFEARCAVPEIFRTHDRDDEKAGVPASYPLTRRYWAKKIQGVIVRHRAIGLWANLRLQGPDSVLSFEEVLAGLSAFFDYASVEV
jgi:F-box protein 21